VGVPIGAAVAVAPEIFGALAKRMPIPARMAATISGNNVLRIIWIN
jgi:hypothetical protein